MSAPTQSVFISYTRENLAAARRIADALSAFEVEVWFDEEGLEGGDAWDQKIRRQIKECSLFIPIISTQTQARREAYFRLEWKLAEERTHLMAEGTAFLLPIAIDDTLESGALVPDSFLRVQWMRLPRGVPKTGFVDRVRALLEAQRSASGSTPVPVAPAPTPGFFRGWWLAGEVLLAAALVAFALWPKPTPAPAARPAAESAAPSPPAKEDKSIAVLPFVNMSEDKGNAFFADGVHEEILTDLANIGEFKVIARTSVMQYRDTAKPVRQIAAELGVAYVVEGSVRRSGNKVRVTGQLIKASTEAHLWAKNYDGDLTDVFALQSKLAEEIATALQAVISPRERSRLDSRPTQNTAAYDLYLKGREQFRVETNWRDGVAAVEPLFMQAVKLDPGFALAWLALGRVHFRAYSSFDHSPTRLEQAKKCIDTAVRLAPEDPQVTLGLGNYWETANDLKQARTLYQQVARDFPNNAEVLIYLSYVDRKEGHWAEALAGMRKAVILDPRSPDVHTQFGRLLFQLRRYEEIERQQKLQAELVESNGLFDRYYSAMLPYYAHGASEEMEALVASVPPAARRTETDAIIVCARWAYLKGDAAGFTRIWEEAGPNWHFGIAQDRYDQITVAAAFLKLNQPGRARPLLEQQRDRLTAQLAAEPKNAANWCDLALVQAMLGDKAAAREILSTYPAVKDRADEAARIYAWIGDKGPAVAKLAALLRQPSTENMKVNILRHSIDWWPLQGDPAFEALVNDPKNNAPLF